MINISLLLQGFLLTFVSAVASTLIWVGITDAQSWLTATAGHTEEGQQLAQGNSPMQGGLKITAG